MKQPDCKQQRGATLVEYCLLVGLVALVAIMAVRTFGMKVSEQFVPVVEGFE